MGGQELIVIFVGFAVPIRHASGDGPENCREERKSPLSCPGVPLPVETAFHAECLD